MFYREIKHTVGIAMLALIGLSGSAALAAESSMTHEPVDNVVLVHGAWADGSSWHEVIPLLQRAGLHVTAVQNRLTSLKDADSDVKRALARQKGPTILVGHSWSGTAISDVGDDPKVAALVYVAARAPKAGEDFVALQKTFPGTPVRAGVEKFDGFTTLSEDAYLKYFANGIPTEEAKVLYAEQQPTAATLFSERTTHTAWQHKPTFYAVSKDDQTISPKFERFLAKRMDAKTIEVDAGHLSMISKPEQIAGLILQAAGHSPQ